MESDNKSGGGDSSGGRLLVDESSWDVQSDRKRFQIDLKQGETTIVSWTKLLRDAGIPVDHSPPPSPDPPMEYRSVPRDVPNKRKTRSQGGLTTEVINLEPSPRNV